MLAINFAVGEATYRWRWFERLVQGRPLPLVRDGKLVMRNMKRERVTLEELRSALRKQGIDGVTVCKHAVLESDGTLTAVRNDVVAAPARGARRATVIRGRCACVSTSGGARRLREVERAEHAAGLGVARVGIHAGDAARRRAGPRRAA